jgi:ABC-type lipoprotein export system ATPase subunit
MTLLQLEHVSKRDRRSLGERFTLRDISLEMEAGEVVAIWGQRRSGRSTLLRVAAGVEAPDSGVVRMEGRDLSARGGEMLGDGIGYCLKTFRPNEGHTILDHVIVSQVARGVAPSLAARHAHEAMERAGIEQCGELRPSELDCAELVRASIARALALQPRLLLIDEPTVGVELGERDGILLLLQSLAEQGMAILTSTGESTGLSGARALQLSDGELSGRSTRELAPVVRLRRHG